MLYSDLGARSLPPAQVLQLSSDFLDLLGWASSRHRGEQFREQVRQVEACLARGERLPLPLPQLVPSLSGSLSMQASMGLAGGP